MSGRSSVLLPGERSRGGGDLGQLAVLRCELRGRRDLDLLHLLQRSLGEGREPPQRFDLDIEHVDPHRAILGGGIHVEQASAHREMAALLDLVDALVAGRDELGCALVEVEQLSDPQRERVRPQLRVGDLLGQGHRAHHDHGPPVGVGFALLAQQ